MNRFDLLPKENEAALKFLDKLPKKYKYDDVKITFSNVAGIGRGVTIEVGPKSKDITDYDMF